MNTLLQVCCKVFSPMLQLWFPPMHHRRMPW
jgi:hypothetical protein